MAATPNQQIGCLWAVIAFPNAVLWIVILARLLLATNAGTLDWCLFVGYCVFSAASLLVGTVLKIASK